ncbi:MAG: NAD(P)-dependent oxidoreductase [Rhizobiales bacterium]|nr:NAD(P)-dependent oxidoreductase [Hyphomicrobiales bacterium]
MSKSAMKVGFVGVGLMGHGMAANLLKAGHDLTVIAHRNRQPVDDLVARGAREAKSLAELAGAAHFIILCVTNADVVQSVVDELFDHLTGDHVIIDTSTSDPVVTEKLAGRLAAKGVAFADSPLTGGAQQAAEGVLGAIVGGSEQTFARIKPVLEAFCTRIGHFGPAGSGHRAKLINNYLVMSMVASIADTFNVARRAGIDWASLFDVMKCGSNYSEALRRIVEPALEGDLDGYKFTLRNAQKDVGYYLSFADDAGLTSDLAREVMAVYERSVAEGHGDLFLSRLIDPETAGKDADA